MDLVALIEEARLDGFRDCKPYALHSFCLQ